MTTISSIATGVKLPAVGGVENLRPTNKTGTQFAQVEGRRRDLLADKYDLSPILQACQAEATAYLERCVKLLGKMPDNHPRQCLGDICSFVINRTY